MFFVVLRETYRNYCGGEWGVGGKEADLIFITSINQRRASLASLAHNSNSTIWMRSGNVLFLHSAPMFIFNDHKSSCQLS